VAHMTVTDLDSGSQGHVECRLESDDDDTRNSFSLHRYQSDSDHFRSVCESAGLMTLLVSLVEQLNMPVAMWVLLRNVKRE